MDVHEALYTTRAMRRVRPDPIPVELQARILDAAVRAPSGTNSQGWRFLLVDDPEVKGRLGPVYRDCIAQLWATIYAETLAAMEAQPDDPENARTARQVPSVQYLAEHFEQVPMFLFVSSQRDQPGSPIFPAVWSAMLAARAEGVGSALTTVLAFRRDDVFELPGVPTDEGWAMQCCVSFGCPTGRGGDAARRPVHEVTYWHLWGSPPGFEVTEPLW